MLAQNYAKALYELGSKKEHVPLLRQMLARRGHLALMPSILSEYQKLALADERMALHTKDSIERRRTRTLLELYRKLVA